MFQGFQKATPYGGVRKLRLTLPPVRRVEIYEKGLKVDFRALYLFLNEFDLKPSTYIE